jgi:hypothetical protein
MQPTVAAQHMSSGFTEQVPGAPPPSGAPTQSFVPSFTTQVLAFASPEVSQM